MLLPIAYPLFLFPSSFSNNSIFNIIVALDIHIIMHEIACSCFNDNMTYLILLIIIILKNIQALLLTFIRSITTRSCGWKAFSTVN